MMRLFFTHSITQMHDPIFSFPFILSFILFFFILALTLSFSPRKNSSKTPPTYPISGLTRNPQIQDPTIQLPSDDDDDQSRLPAEHDPTRTLTVETLPSASENSTTFLDDRGCDDPNPISESGQNGKKKKKRNGKKKKMNSAGAEDENEAHEKSEVERENSGSDTQFGSTGSSPFTSSSSAMQRKIKAQYDELVKCHDSKTLTFSQVVQFANSLVDARSELQQKADVLKRKFVITKALLFKADRSSFDRIRQQTCKLELEQKRLEDDASVYNWLQQQFKLSPAYRKMLEIGVTMEKEKACKLGERGDDEFSVISFEELLAQEKKDSFWQKNGKSRQCSS